PPDLPKRRRDGVGAGAEDTHRAALDQAGAVVQACDLARDLVSSAEADPDGVSAFFQQLATEQCGPRPPRHGPSRVNQPAVAAFDERRDDPRAGGVRQALERRGPGALDERSVAPGVPDLAGGKNDERA